MRVQADDQGVRFEWEQGSRETRVLLTGERDAVYTMLEALQESLRSTVIGSEADGGEVPEWTDLQLTERRVTGHRRVGLLWEAEFETESGATALFAQMCAAVGLMEGGAALGAIEVLP